MLKIENRALEISLKTQSVKLKAERAAVDPILWTA
jgi:hypothetical protein